MIKRVLVTGAKGFIGSNVTKYFKSINYLTYGIGHGSLSKEERDKIGLDYWKDKTISINSILEFEQRFDVIVHCGGSGSVSFSMDNPYRDFKRTVHGTLEVLEFIRLHNPNAYLIYPSSPAVQGECEDKPIKENFLGKPTSPYGYHKKISENLCQSYSENFGLKIAVVRLFSVYGLGLQKQLLWDAVQKIKNNNGRSVVFWGTGDETRDFIHIDDVVRLFDLLLTLDEKFTIVNGGSGKRYKIKSIVNIIKKLIDPRIEIEFNNKTNAGNPMHYWADTKKLSKLNFEITKNLEQEIQTFVDWAVKLND